ncbi:MULTISPECIES: hypothetical protein [Nostocales]|uniref:Uncharacterized protein n=3 Tax=Nostocales TaxID=1161 RepID=A0A0C1R639_9CYAN|nr:hypothetical protein [Tolypothrix bouteillei]KAF3888020.1 hypothetical protein DA73_0400022910 [Tolypothrix bouteillei VB521301]
MNNVNPEEFSTKDNDTPLEQELTGSERGKNYQVSRRSQSVTIQQTDGTTIVHHYTREDGIVTIDPDVREYFPNAEAVNNALRTLINLVPKKHN